jgi:hypothetical protein
MIEPFTREGHIHRGPSLFAIGAGNPINDLGQPSSGGRAIGYAQQHVCRAGEMFVAAYDQPLYVSTFKFRHQFSPRQKRQSQARVFVSSSDVNRSSRMALLLSMVCTVKSE